MFLPVINAGWFPGHEIDNPPTGVGYAATAFDPVPESCVDAVPCCGEVIQPEEKRSNSKRKSTTDNDHVRMITHTSSQL